MCQSSCRRESLSGHGHHKRSHSLGLEGHRIHQGRARRISSSDRNTRSFSGTLLRVQKHPTLATPRERLPRNQGTVISSRRAYPQLPPNPTNANFHPYGVNLSAASTGDVHKNPQARPVGALKSASTLQLDALHDEHLLRSGNGDTTASLVRHLRQSDYTLASPPKVLRWS